MMILASFLLTTAHAEPGTYDMNNLGGAVVLERGWDLAPGGWSDGSFKFQRANRHVQVYVWYAPTQPDVDDANAAAWGAHHVGLVNRQAGISGASLDTSRVEQVAGRPTAVAEISASFQEENPVVAHVLSFASGGKTVFIRAMGRRQYADEVKADALLIAETMTLQEPALEPVRALSVADQFTATLPEGWRLPFDTELEAVREVTGQIGEAELSPSRCMVGMRAHPGTEPDVIFSCGTYMHLGPVDTYSFEHVEREVYAEFFGSAETPVDAAQQQDIGDRLGFYYQPRDGYRLALAPYDQGLMMTWGLSVADRDAEIDAAMRAMLASVQFTGPDGGAPIIRPDKWVVHYIQHRPTSPPVLLGGAVLLAIVGGIGFLATRRRKNPYELDEDDDL